VDVTARKLLLRIAIGLLIVAGAPVACVAVIVLPSAAGSKPTSQGVPLELSLAFYALFGFVGAIGMLTGRRWGWPVAATSVVAGIVTIVVLLRLPRDHSAILGPALLYWSITFACLLAGAPDRPPRGRTGAGSERLNEP
jgi:hypothetical protein